jgi:F-type H+-transporting ATPase subunit epsilon
MPNTISVSIVSAEEAIYSGQAELLVAPGEAGELGILPNHAPLLTRIRPGTVKIKIPGQAVDELIYVSGGMMEVQPKGVTILADTSIRARDLDEAKALEAKREAEEKLTMSVSEQERAILISQLAEYTAQLAAIQKLRKSRQ